MPRNVAALYDTRAEAEVARGRLISEAGARSPRIISRETAAAIDGLGFAASDVDAYRDRLRQGAHLVVAQLPPGASPRRVIEVLEQSISDGSDMPDEDGWSQPEPGVQVKLPDEVDDEVPDGRPAFRKLVAEPPREAGAERPHLYWPPEPADEPMRPVAQEPVPEPAPEVVEEERVPLVEEQLRVGTRQVARGGARVRSFTREDEVEEQVSLEEEIVDLERRPSDRQLSEEEVVNAGLFKERVFEIAEMREEPVVSKIAVVREEIIVRKRVTERQETVRDTLRRTEVEIDDLATEDRAQR